MKIAVIPARGGSKRIPRKNIRVFCGKPIIAWSIEAAKRSGLFEHIVVSTDDAEIAAIAMKWGAETPFTRPCELSDDYAGTTETIAHATRWALSAGWPVSAVCCIYPTAPFLDVADLQRGAEILESGKWEFVFSVAEFPASVYRSLHPAVDGGLEMLFPEYFPVRSQDLPTAFHDAGQFYWGKPESWISLKRIFSHHSTWVMIPRWRVQDIDTLDDWERAEIIAPSVFIRDR